MPHRKTAQKTPNKSEASREARIRMLAQYDWLRVPPSVIQHEMEDMAWATIVQWRMEPLYLEALEEIKTAWRQAQLDLPNTGLLRKEISHGLSISLKRLIKIVASSSTTNKDLIAAAKLFAQMDGRFLGTDAGDGDKPLNEEQESIAAELVQALKRTEQQRIQ